MAEAHEDLALLVRRLEVELRHWARHPVPPRAPLRAPRCCPRVRPSTHAAGARGLRGSPHALALPVHWLGGADGCARAPRAPASPRAPAAPPLPAGQTHLLRRGDRKGQSILSSITPQVMVRRLRAVRLCVPCRSAPVSRARGARGRACAAQPGLA